MYQQDKYNYINHVVMAVHDMRNATDKIIFFGQF